MDKNEPKKWRKDYSELLKCWALLKESEMLAQMARNQLRKFKAEDKAINRLKTFVEKIESQTKLSQTTTLWQQSVDQFINQNNFSASAECLENLSDIQLKYGTNDQKKEAFHTLMRASKYHKKSGDNKRAIIAMKRALTLIEFSPEKDIDLIVDKYKECGLLYEALDLRYLSKLNRKIGYYFQEIVPFIQTSSESIDVIYNSDLDSDENESNTEEVDDKQKVRHKIQEMARITRSHTSGQTNTENTEDVVEKTSKYGSKQLLRQNLNNIFNNSNTSEETEVENDDKIERKNEKIFIKTNDQKKLTTQIIVVPTPPSVPSVATQSTSGRKRRLKSKEKSEELPENRLLKLNRQKFEHNFIVDERNPLKRLFCTLCNDSVLSYRWSIITDHLKTRKHMHLSEKMATESFISSLEAISHKNDNYDKNVNFCEIPVFSINDMTTEVQTHSGLRLGTQFNSNPIQSTSTQDSTYIRESFHLNNNFYSDSVYISPQITDQSLEDRGDGSHGTPQTFNPEFQTNRYQISSYK